MEIKLNYTQDELHILLDALNHARVALGSIYASARLGCDLPFTFEEKFKKMSFNEIDEYTKVRSNSLRELYEYLLTFEE